MRVREVETASMRDFPQQFRVWEILRNSDDSISILTTCVDPVVETDSPAWKSRGYGVGAERIFGRLPLDDTSSHSYNAELVVKLSPAMQTKIAGYGTPLGYQTHIDRTEARLEVGFLGSLQYADALTGPWNDVPTATTSPCPMSASSGHGFYRAVK